MGDGIRKITSKVRCWCCGKPCAVTSKGYIHKHKSQWPIIDGVCVGSGTSPDTVIDRRVSSLIAWRM